MLRCCCCISLIPHLHTYSQYAPIHIVGKHLNGAEWTPGNSTWVNAVCRILHWIFAWIGSYVASPNEKLKLIHSVIFHDPVQFRSMHADIRMLENNNDAYFSCQQKCRAKRTYVKVSHRKHFRVHINENFACHKKKLHLKVTIRFVFILKHSVLLSSDSHINLQAYRTPFLNCNIEPLKRN